MGNVLGVDAEQVAAWRRGLSFGDGVCDDPDLAESVNVGRMLSWGPLYAKLISASQLQRRRHDSKQNTADGLAPVQPVASEHQNGLCLDSVSNAGSATQAKLLVVAFSASQAIP